MTAARGITMTVLAGRTVPKPLAPTTVDVLESVEITEAMEGRSGFQLVFGASRGSPYDLIDYPLLKESSLAPWSRIVVLVTFNAVPTVLIDGLITRQELQPSQGDGSAKLVLTGEDLSVAMDREAKTVAHPAQSENVIASKIILSYGRYGILPQVMPPPVIVVPPPTQRMPMQHDTDLGYLLTMAARFGYVFQVRPGRVPLSNVAYWGPPRLVGLPQPALTVAMSGETNVESISFRTDALAAASQAGRIIDPMTNRAQEVAVSRASWPALGRTPALQAWGSDGRQALLDGAEGMTYAQARALAQGRTDGSSQRTVVAEGELDTLSYGSILRAAGLVGVRGVGRNYDGDYYVAEVTHQLSRGSFRQKFRLNRGGIAALKPLVRP